MTKTLKKHAHGFAYLFAHPQQLKRLIIREIRYGQRLRSKRKWVEWQKHKTYPMTLEHSTAVSHARPLNIARIKIISDMVSRLGNGLRVLDVGCGDGVVGEPILKMGNYVTSVELPKIAALAHKRRASSVVAGDGERLAFASNIFDVVLASEVVEHLWNPLSFFDEAHRVLRAKGYMIMETPEGRESLRYDDHKQYFTVERLKQMLDAKFNICEVKRLEPILGAPTPTIILLMQKIKDNNQ